MRSLSQRKGELVSCRQPWATSKQSYCTSSFVYACVMLTPPTNGRFATVVSLPAKTGGSPPFSAQGGTPPVPRSPVTTGGSPPLPHFLRNDTRRSATSASFACDNGRFATVASPTPALGGTPPLPRNNGRFATVACVS